MLSLKVTNKQPNDKFIVQHLLAYYEFESEFQAYCNKNFRKGKPSENE